MKLLETNQSQIALPLRNPVTPALSVTRRSPVHPTWSSTSEFTPESGPTSAPHAQSLLRTSQPSGTTLSCIQTNGLTFVKFVINLLEDPIVWNTIKPHTTQRTGHLSVLTVLKVLRIKEISDHTRKLSTARTPLEIGRWGRHCSSNKRVMWFSNCFRKCLSVQSATRFVTLLPFWSTTRKLSTERGNYTNVSSAGRNAWRTVSWKSTWGRTLERDLSNARTALKVSEGRATLLYTSRDIRVRPSLNVKSATEGSRRKLSSSNTRKSTREWSPSSAEFVENVLPGRTMSKSTWRLTTASRACWGTSTARWWCCRPRRRLTAGRRSMSTWWSRTFLVVQRERTPPPLWSRQQDPGTLISPEESTCIKL